MRVALTGTTCFSFECVGLTCSSTERLNSRLRISRTCALANDTEDPLGMPAGVTEVFDLCHTFYVLGTA